MADGTGGLYGYMALIIGAMVSVTVARISRTREDEPDLSTIEGLAAELVRLRGRVATLETERTKDRQQLAAEGRYRRRLTAALAAAGLPVPDPDPEDIPLLRG